MIIPLVLIFVVFPPLATAHVNIKGVDGSTHDNVKLMLAINKEKCDAPKWKIRGLFKNADKHIDLALRALGYYHATVSKNLKFNTDCFQADFNIIQGPRIIVRDIQITLNGDAQNDADFKTLLHKLPLKTGDALHHGRYESIKSKLQSLAIDKGYLKAEFSEKKLLINKTDHAAQIKLVFNSGKRLKFGDIEIQQSVLQDELVKRLLTIKTGDYYNSEDLAKTYNNLAQSGYFDTVDIRSKLEHIKQGRVPVTIHLQAKPRHHYVLGVGYDTDIGPLFNASYINRRINQHGHFFTANLDVSPVLSTLDAEYIIPLDNPVSDFLSLGGWLKREQTKTFSSLSATLSARLRHAYDNGWRQTLFLNWSYESYRADSDSGGTVLLVPGGNWLKSVADNPIRPSKGYRVELEAKGSYQNPISDVSFLQGYLSASWLHTFGYGGKIFGRTLQGATWVDDITALPTSYRYYAGGINSIRGYDYKELGPKNDNNAVVGGRFLTVLSAEYEHNMLEDWALAAFIDSGNAYNLDNFELKTGVGLGLRWYSPVGPLRLDFAVPLSESNSSFQIHFSTGSRL